MIRNRVVEDNSEPDEVRKLREDLFNELNAGTRVLLGRVEEIQNDGTVIVSVDGQRISAANYALAGVTSGEYVAIIQDTDNSAYLIGVKR